MTNIRDELHDALDEERFSSQALLARVMPQIELRHGAPGNRFASMIAAVLAVALLATLLIVRANRDDSVPNLNQPASKCAQASNASRGRVGSITYYTVRPNLKYIGSIAPDRDCSLWFVTEAYIVRVTTSGAFAEYAIPDAYAQVQGIAVGPDGNVWFTQSFGKRSPASSVRVPAGGRVSKLTNSGVLTEYSSPAVNSSPSAITAGPDGNLWFTDPGTNQVVKVTTSGEFKPYTIPTPDSGPGAITAGPNGNVWFLEGNPGKVAVVTTSGIITEFNLPAALRPISIAAGPDGNLWITMAGFCCAGGGPGKVAKMTTSGVLTLYAIPRNKLVPGESLLRDQPPRQIIAGPDGNLWFIALNNLDRVTTSGVITQFVIPAQDRISDLNGIAAGPDGNVWFTGGTLDQQQLPLLGKLLIS